MPAGGFRNRITPPAHWRIRERMLPPFPQQLQELRRIRARDRLLQQPSPAIHPRHTRLEQRTICLRCRIRLLGKELRYRPIPSRIFELRKADHFVIPDEFYPGVHHLVDDGMGADFIISENVVFRCFGQEKQAGIAAFQRLVFWGKVVYCGCRVYCHHEHHTGSPGPQ